MAPAFAVEFQHGAEQFQRRLEFFVRMLRIEFDLPRSAQIDELLVEIADDPVLLVAQCIISPEAEHFAAQRVKAWSGFGLNKEGEHFRHERPFAGAAFDLDQLVMARQVDGIGGDRDAGPARQLQRAADQHFNCAPP